MGGDATSAAIAASSVIAKVTRDRFMRRMEERYPGWEFAAHVGYSTPEHRAAIEKLGVSPLHRHVVPVDGVPAARALKQYYEQRAREYDEWYEGTGLFAARSRPGWEEDREALIAVLRGLPPARTLDVACGTGYLTQHLPGSITGLDQSPSMIEIASARMPAADFIVADALPAAVRRRLLRPRLHRPLLRASRGAPAQFLAEARRVAGELVVADAALRPDHEPEEWQERVLNDGSRHRGLQALLLGRRAWRRSSAGERSCTPGRGSSSVRA